MRIVRNHNVQWLDCSLCRCRNYCPYTCESATEWRWIVYEQHHYLLRCQIKVAVFTLFDIDCKSDCTCEYIAVLKVMNSDCIQHFFGIFALVKVYSLIWLVEKSDFILRYWSAEFFKKRRRSSIRILFGYLWLFFLWFGFACSLRFERELLFGYKFQSWRCYLLFQLIYCLQVDECGVKKVYCRPFVLVQSHMMEGWWCSRCSVILEGRRRGIKNLRSFFNFCNVSYRESKCFATSLEGIFGASANPLIISVMQS